MLQHAPPLDPWCWCQVGSRRIIEVLHVGRHPFCDFCIQDDPAVSFHHLCIRRTANGLTSREIHLLLIACLIVSLPQQATPVDNLSFVDATNQALRAHCDRAARIPYDNPPKQRLVWQIAAGKVPPATHNEQLTGASIIINSMKCKPCSSWQPHIQ